MTLEAKRKAARRGGAPMTPQEISEARQALGLSQSDMAAMTGYGAAARWSELERGKRAPGGAVIRLIRAYLDGYRPPDWPST